ncbi:DUF4136 domain-containing protein [Flexithrix dorotheae]|uniref:DUF4136 domain-containing protein n=1 Tax=Flexithrix dorotheae TaxID=70993 RepID=UPI00035D3738|nr:DUF4136 domain-containing protein [Flexithrix dorotheae]
MKVYYFLVTTLAILLLLSCSDRYVVNSKYNPEDDFSQYKTFDWSEFQEGVKPGNPLHDNDYLREIIKESIENEMDEKGFKKSEENPDLFIEYFLNLEDKQAVITAPLDFGVGTDQKYEVIKEELKKAMLIIHIEDRLNQKTLWIGSAESLLEASPKNLDKRVEKVIDEIFKKFPEIELDPDAIIH